MRNIIKGNLPQDIAARTLAKFAEKYPDAASQEKLLKDAFSGLMMSKTEQTQQLGYIRGIHEQNQKMALK